MIVGWYFLLLLLGSNNTSGWFNLFVLQGMANKDMGFIAKSAFPLFLLMILAVVLVVIFPEIALWMPEQMVKNIN